MNNEKNLRRSDRKRGRLIEYRKPGPRPSKKQSFKPRKWTADDILTYLQCIQEHGHKNFTKLQEYFPNKSLEDIKAYFRAMKTKATCEGYLPGLDDWLSICNSEAKKHNIGKWSDSIQIAQVLKYLSVDGLLESHPLPEACQGIDFPAAYRVLYQATMGYPIQPINKETAEFIDESLKELNKEVTKTQESDVIMTCLREVYNREKNGSYNPKKPVCKKTENITVNRVENKPIKTYQRKRKIAETISYSVSLPVGSSQQENTPQSSFLSVDGNNLQVHIACGITNNKKELLNELYKSVSFNPFQIPERLLKGELKFTKKKHQN